MKRVREPRNSDDVPGYQLMASVLQWKAGDGVKAYHDPIRVPNFPEDAGRPNVFFKEYYTVVAQNTLGLEAREHTCCICWSALTLMVYKNTILYFNDYCHFIIFIHILTSVIILKLIFINKISRKYYFKIFIKYNKP